MPKIVMAKKRKASKKKEGGTSKKNKPKQSSAKAKSSKKKSTETSKVKGGLTKKAGGKKAGAKKGVSKDDDAQLTVFGAGFQKLAQEPLYMHRLVLLTDAIYGKKVPKEHKGLLFAYKVVSYNTETKHFKLKYMNRMIKCDGVAWENQDGGRLELDDVKFGPVKEGDKLYKQAVRRVAAYTDKDRDVAVGIGECCPHLTTEVDCESLFSESGYRSHPTRSLTSIPNYERLVVTKHRMSRIYCPPLRVLNLFLQRWKDKDWDEKDERDDKEFLEIEKEIWLETNPHLRDLLEEEEEEMNEKVKDRKSKKSKKKKIIVIDNESGSESGEESGEDESSDECDSGGSSGDDSDEDSKSESESSESNSQIESDDKSDSGSDSESERDSGDDEESLL